MGRKEIRKYIALIISLVALSFVTPVLIRVGTQLMINKILNVESDQKPDEPKSEAPELIIEKESEHEDTNHIRDADSQETENGQSVDEASKGDVPSDADMSADADVTDEEALQDQKESYDQALAAYEALFQPELTEARSGLLELFVGGREERFLKTAADYLYSYYGDLYTVKEIMVIDFIFEEDDHLTCQIQMMAETNGKMYDEYFYAEYNTQYDFYSLYSFYE